MKIFAIIILLLALIPIACTRDLRKSHVPISDPVEKVSIEGDRYAVK